MQALVIFNPELKLKPMSLLAMWGKKPEPKKADTKAKADTDPTSPPDAKRQKVEEEPAKEVAVAASGNT
jgi:hypothetical protein